MVQTVPLQVVQITDSHLFGDRDQRLLNLPTADSLTAVLKAVRQRVDPDIFLITGDLSQDETPESYQHLREMVASFNVPTYWIPGNHDDPDVLELRLRGDLFRVSFHLCPV